MSWERLAEAIHLVLAESLAHQAMTGDESLEAVVRSVMVPVESALEDELSFQQDEYRSEVVKFIASEADRQAENCFNEAVELRDKPGARAVWLKGYGEWRNRADWVRGFLHE